VTEPIGGAKGGVGCEKERDKASGGRSKDTRPNILPVMRKLVICSTEIRNPRQGP